MITAVPEKGQKVDDEETRRIKHEEALRRIAVFLKKLEEDYGSVLVTESVAALAVTISVSR